MGFLGSPAALVQVPAALRAVGLPVDLEPTHPKMGPLVTETLRAAPALLARKRR